jgi:hypothetical protein
MKPSVPILLPPTLPRPLRAVIAQATALVGLLALGALHGA